jgi:hypothetical protein
VHRPATYRRDFQEILCSGAGNSAAGSVTAAFFSLTAATVSPGAGSASIERTEDRRHKLREVVGVGTGQGAYPFVDAAVAPSWIIV